MIQYIFQVAQTWQGDFAGIITIAVLIVAAIVGCVTLPNKAEKG